MDQIQPKSEEFLKKFGEHFLKSYGISAFLKIKADVEAEHNPDERKLMYRDWASIPDSEVRGGEVYIQEGEGVGTFTGWKKYFAKALPDNNLGMFGNEKKAREPKGKPKFVIKMAGYQIENSVTYKYQTDANTLASELDCEAPEIGYSSYSWALVHPLRKNYIMQLHKGEGGGACACIGGNKVEPADSGSENAGKVQEWIDLLEGLIANSSPRDLESNVLSMAFERTVQKMCGSIDELDGFEDDGTEGEILGDMAFLAIVEAVAKPDLQENIKTAPFGKIPLWMKTRGTAAGVINKVMDPGWKTMQKQGDELYKKIEPTIKSGLEPILKEKLKLQDKIKDKIGGKVGDLLGKKVTPHCKGIFNAFDKPMRKAMKAIEKAYEKNVDEIVGSSCSELSKAVIDKLDQVPRCRKYNEELEESASDMVEPMEKVKKEDKENMLDTLKPGEIKGACHMTMLELFDAMIYTTEELMKEDKDIGKVKSEVLKRYKYDSVYTVQQFVSSTIVNIFLTKVRSLIGEFVDPILDEVKGIIPEDLQEILDVEAEVLFLLDALIGEPVNKMIQANYTLPK